VALFCASFFLGFIALDVQSRGIERMNGVAAFFPADGLALAFLYVVGPRFVPIVFLSYALTGWLVFGLDLELALGGSLVGTALQAGTALLFQRVLRGDLARGHLADLGKLLVAVTALSVSGGLVLTWTFVASGTVALEQSNSAFFTSATGLATGALMMGSPAILAAAHLRAWLGGGPWRDLLPNGHALGHRRLAIDALLLTGSTVATVAVAFSPRTREFQPLYLCFVPIIWLALRRGLPGAAIAILFVDAAVIVAFRVERLPTAELDKIQVLQLALSLMGLILGTVVTERETAQRAARAADALRHDVELARRMAERNQALRQVLDTIDEGLLGVTADGRFTAERSAMVERWFGPVASEAGFVEYIARIDSAFAESFDVNYEAFREGVLPVALYLAQMPARLRQGDRHFAVSYLPLEARGPNDGLLVVIKDITEQLQAAQHDAEQREQLAAVGELSRDRAGFLAFFEDASQLIQDVTSASLDLATQRRLVHTLKANAAMSGLSSVAELCHQIEDDLAENGKVESTPLTQALHDRWLALTASLQVFLGDRARGIIELPASELDGLCAELERGMPVSLALIRLTRLRFEPVEVPLTRLANQARALSQRLGKGDPVIDIDARELRLDPLRWGPLFSEMVHMIRNSVDHGFDTAEERASRQKPRRPRLRLGAYQRARRLEFEIEDDGRGIDWHAVRQSAARHGIVAETESELTAALFASGVTSREAVTETSGRGVGLAGVYARVRALGGSISVTSERGIRTRWVLSFPLSALGRAEGMEASVADGERSGSSRGTIETEAAVVVEGEGGSG
jgi:glucose-6-phosphate-specific signal transduction histidine kinase/HPt (histidine-containing phosphotransfer) domain-containing protein